MPSKPLVPPDEFILLTMLLRLSSTLNNNDGDISMRNYTEIKQTRPSPPTDLEESEFDALDSMSAVLSWDRDVVTSSYTDGLRYNVAVLADRQEYRNGMDDLQGPTVDCRDLDRYTKMLPSPNFATTSNPERICADSNHFGVRIVKEGNSIWPTIREQDAFHTWKSRRITLEDHAATVADYINEYKDIVHKNPQACFEYSDKFFDYLISQCWRKMYQQISTFPALAFAYGLVTHWSIFQANIMAFKWDDPEFARRGHGDKTLACCIRTNFLPFTSLERAFGAQAPEQYQSFLKGHEPFKQLIRAANSCVESNNALYTKDSAESFHRFLFTALVMYAVSINQLRHAFQNSALEAKEEQKVIRLAKGFTRIFTNILSSSSFKRHMRVITMDGRFLDCLTANPRNKDAYWKFGQQYHIINTETGKASGYDSGFDLDPAMSRALQLDYLPQLNAFVKWARSLVAQFIGRRGLEIQASLSQKMSIQISVIDVNPITYRMPTWSELLDVARRALQQGSTSTTEVERVVETLQGHLDMASYTTLDPDSEAFRTLNQFKTLYSKGPTHSTLPGVISFHCEAAMAALSQFGCKVKERPGNGSEDVDSVRLRKICKNLKTSSIATSKLCCPVCWDLLDIVTSDSEGVTPRARPCFSLLWHHSTIHYTALPPIIPQDVHDQMISRFQRYLCNQLSQLVPPPNRLGAGSATQQCKQWAMFEEDSELMEDYLGHLLYV